MGHVAEKVMQISAVPVMLCKSNATRGVDSEQGMSDRRMRSSNDDAKLTIICAVDSTSHLSRACFDLSARFARPGDWVQVVHVLERLIVYKPEDYISDGLARALSEITFMPAHPALGTVHESLRLFVRHSGLDQQLKSCTRGLAHESAAVRLMALQQLLDALQRAPRHEVRRGGSAQISHDCSRS